MIYPELGEVTNATIEYKCSHSGGFYLTTELVLKGRGIKYNGIELEGSRIYFKFNSTGYSFNFSIEAGFDIDGSYYKLKARSSDIFREFEKIKLNL